MDEAGIELTLKKWATASSEFREELLQQCLRVLDQGDADELDAVMELDDSELELLAAAGDVYSNMAAKYGKGPLA